MNTRAFLGSLIGIFVVVNLILAGGIWYTTQPNATPFQWPAILTTSTNTCASQLTGYLQHSNYRMREYFTLYDQINKSENSVLADQLMALTTDIIDLPTQCPDEINNILYANYTSVYMTTPIHLHVIITRSTAENIENPRTRQALALFFKEVDQAEMTAYRLLQFID